MRIVAGNGARSMVDCLASRSRRLEHFDDQVRPIVDEVRIGGDRVLRKYSERWDGLKPGQSLRVSRAEMTSGWKSLGRELQSSLRVAAGRIRQFSEWQKPKPWMRNQSGISRGQLVKPLDSVACYVPGGRYPLVSTVLMTVIPAQVAGVKNIRIASPKPSTEVLAAAGMLGVQEFYRIGGAQAIAALAYGTESIRRVDKIVGPGNAYVTAAKKLVSFDCAIDFLAGPTEALILSSSGNPDFIAADLVAQAEHDVESLSIFLTTSRKLAHAVSLSVSRIAEGNKTAQESLGNHGVILLAASRAEARAWANRLASEHITVEAEDLRFIDNAGSIFVGDYSAQAAGDYASGPNHVLPTSGQARFRGGLSVADFVKVITVQNLSRTGLRRIAPAIESLAEAEGLPGHRNSVRVRCARA